MKRSKQKLVFFSIFSLFFSCLPVSNESLTMKKSEVGQLRNNTSYFRIFDRSKNIYADLNFKYDVVDNGEILTFDISRPANVEKKTSITTRRERTHVNNHSSRVRISRKSKPRSRVKMDQFIKSQELSIKEIFLVVKNKDNDRVPLQKSFCGTPSKAMKIDLNSLSHLEFAIVDDDKYYRYKQAKMEFWVYEKNQKKPHILIGPSFSYDAIEEDGNYLNNVITASERINCRDSKNPQSLADNNVAVSVPDCDETRPDTAIIRSPNDLTLLNRPDLRVFCLKSGDYRSQGKITLSSSGTKERPRVIRTIEQQLHPFHRS